MLLSRAMAVYRHNGAGPLWGSVEERFISPPLVRVQERSLTESEIVVFSENDG